VRVAGEARRFRVPGCRRVRASWVVLPC
jgi:hypothetical protein